MQRLYSEFLGGARGLALLIVRLVAGSAMALHGWQKINGEGMMHWGDKMGIPGPLQACAALAEFGGGIAWMLGALMPIASLSLVITMGVATYMMVAKFKAPYVGGPGGPSAESAAGYLALAILFLVVGPGRLSIDSLLFGKSPVVETGAARNLAN